MKEIKGDYWEYVDKQAPDALVCTTNKTIKNDGCLVMGAGIAKDFRDKFPGLDLKWGNQLKQNSNLNLMVRYDSSVGFLVAFPTKENWRYNSYVELILKSAKELKYVAGVFGWEDIVMTRPGCGNGGLNWTNVSKRLGILLDDRFTVINKE